MGYEQFEPPESRIIALANAYTYPHPALFAEKALCYSQIRTQPEKRQSNISQNKLSPSRDDSELSD
jgi:hypothetical protein